MSTPTVLTLPSNASMYLYKDNKTSSFKVELPKRLMYSGFYDVGLTGFNYTRSWYSFPTTKSFHFSVRHTPHDGSPRERRIRVKPGHYVDVQDLLDQLNDPSTKDFVEFVYIHITHKINIIIKKPNYSVALSPDLCHRLGWGECKQGMNIGGGVNSGLYPPERVAAALAAGHTDFGSFIVSPPHVLILDPIDLLYVYCTLAADSHIVGDTEVALLKTIPVQGRHGERVNYEPRIIDWLPLRDSEISTVSVLITDSSGQPIPFEAGTSLVKVHIRKRGFLL